MSENRIPKKVTPHSIKEAVIELRYLSNLPFEVIPGIMFKAFDNSYAYTNKPIKPSMQIQNSPQPGEIRINIANQSLLYNDKVIIHINPGAFVFNCFDDYLGWPEYLPEIEKALSIIASSEIIQQWNRVGIRYVSEYSKKDLRECTKFNFSFGHPDIHSDIVRFRSDFAYKGCRIILKLNNLVPVIAPQVTIGKIESIPTSIIDIDVIRDKLQIKEASELLKIIKENHEYEKELYFGMLQEHFLASLKPEY